MTGNNYLLDTNIISALFKGEEEIAQNILKTYRIFITVVAIGELYFGAEKSGNSSKYIPDIVEISSSYPILSIDANTCKYYGIIKALLRRKGKLVPENDSWIAAIASQYHLTVATRDKHFKAVDGLSVEEW